MRNTNRICRCLAYGIADSASTLSCQHSMTSEGVNPKPSNLKVVCPNREHRTNSQSILQIGAFYGSNITKKGRKPLFRIHNIQKPALGKCAYRISYDAMKLSQASVLSLFMEMLVCPTLALYLTWKGFRSSQGSRQVIISHRMIPNEYTSAALL